MGGWNLGTPEFMTKWAEEVQRLDAEYGPAIPYNPWRPPRPQPSDEMLANLKAEYGPAA